MQLLWCLWILFTSVVANVTLSPWVFPVLLRLETVSFFILALSYGCFELMLLNHEAMDGTRLSDGERSQGGLGLTLNDCLIFVVGISNLLAVAYFLFLAFHLLIDKMKGMADGNGFLAKLFSSHERNVRNLREKVEETSVHLHSVHKRSLYFTFLDTLVSTLSSIQGTVINIKQNSPESLSPFRRTDAPTRFCESSADLGELIYLLSHFPQLHERVPTQVLQPLPFLNLHDESIRRLGVMRTAMSTVKNYSTSLR